MALVDREKSMMNRMMYLEWIRDAVDKSSLVDFQSRKRIVASIKAHDGHYTKAEEEHLRSGLAEFDDFDEQESVALKMVSPSTKAKIALKHGDNMAWGWAATEVSPEHSVGASALLPNPDAFAGVRNAGGRTGSRVQRL